MPLSNDSDSPNENNNATNYILLSQQIVKKKKKGFENSISLALLEREWNFGQKVPCMPVAKLFLGNQRKGKGKEKKLEGNRKR